MGLIQAQIEKAGIPTISVTVVPYVTRNMVIPRAAYLRFPIGNPVGRQHQPEEQATVLGAILDAFEAIDEPGTTVELPFRWRRVAQHVIDPRTEDLSEGYLVAREYSARIGDAYEALVSTCHEARDRLSAALDAIDPETGQPKEIVQLRREIRTLDDLIDLLEKPVHDLLLMNATRYFLVQLAHEGKFR